MRRVVVAAVVLAGCGSGVHHHPQHTTLRPYRDTAVLPDFTATTTTVTTARPPRASRSAGNRQRETAPSVAVARPDTATDLTYVAVPRTLNWAALRRCESGGDYNNKRNPLYRGGYQFGYGTWRSVGGDGDPADASPAEQDMRAARLFERRGRSPWPRCGRLL